MKNQTLSKYYRGISYRRDVRNRKIKRKKRFAQYYYGWGYSKPDGHWDKGKVQCSCESCSFHGRTYSDMKKDVRYENDMRNYNIKENDE